MTADRLRMQDPRTQYPGPPFQVQTQPAPGLAAEMHPKPDHGEESYVGHGRLAGRKALITGGDSGIGRAVAMITKAAIPHLVPGATVINTASRQAYNPSLGLIDYAVTKAGIVDFTKAVSKQLIKRGVRVNAVAPGPFWTPLQPSGGQTQDKLKEFGKDTPMGRPGQPVEVASIYVLLASQESSYVSGEIFGVTGGIAIA